MILLKFQDKCQGFQKISCATDNKKSQSTNSCIFGTADPILLKLVSFCWEWFALWADKFLSVSSGDMAVWFGKEWPCGKSGFIL